MEKAQSLFQQPVESGEVWSAETDRFSEVRVVKERVTFSYARLVLGMRLMMMG